MFRLLTIAAAVVMASGTFALAQTQSHSITVAVDDTTSGDLGIIETFAVSANDGDLISQALRRIIMAAVGEMWLLLQDRIGAGGYLTLDDGATQPLAAWDTITVAKKEQPGTVVLFVCEEKKEPTSEPCHGRPEAIMVCRPGLKEECAKVAMPGRDVKK